MLKIPKIVYKPYDELVIHELVRYKLDDLVNLNALGVQPGGMGKPLYWAAGLAMVTYSLPSTDAVVHDQLLVRRIGLTSRMRQWPNTSL